MRSLDLITYELPCGEFGVRQTFRLRPNTNVVRVLERILSEGNLNAILPVKQKPRHQSKINYGPFETKTAFLLADWYWSSKNKSFQDFQQLVSIFSSPTFRLHEVTNVNWKYAFQLLGANREDVSEGEAAWMSDDGWKTTPVSLDIPFHRYTKDPGTRRHIVGDFRHRSLVSVIRERLSNQKSDQVFHYYPYQATWSRTGDDPGIELYGEMYSSRVFRQADEALQRQPSLEGSRDQGLERVVVALMFWSDSTQLTSFGGASLWPCYLFFGNDSKYDRGRPSECLGNQIAYFLKVVRCLYRNRPLPYTDQTLLAP